MKLLFWILVFLLVWSYALYPAVLWLGKRWVSSRRERSEAQSFPTVSLVIVAHNEEKVIANKIRNSLELDYPKDRLEIVVASDCSTDRTNEIVESFAGERVRLVVTRERKGRANAHNEACATVSSDIIAFSDANSLWERDALKILVRGFEDPKVGYITGRLKYINTDESTVAGSEGFYWRYELFLREAESSIHSVTAGNGAIYAIRQTCYRPIDPLYSHDLVFPSMVVRQGYRAIYDQRALAYEHAGETVDDEYARKVRMFGRAWHYLLRNAWLFNPFEVGFIYAVFMISHRLLRYAAGLVQLGILVVPLFLLESRFFQAVLAAQVLFYCAIYTARNGRLGNKMFTLFYLNLFHYATLAGFWRAVTNRVKPFWLSPQSTRK